MLVAIVARAAAGAVDRKAVAAAVDVWGTDAAAVAGSGVAFPCQMNTTALPRRTAASGGSRKTAAARG